MSRIVMEVFVQKTLEAYVYKAEYMFSQSIYFVTNWHLIDKLTCLLHVKFRYKVLCLYLFINTFF